MYKAFEKLAVAGEKGMHLCVGLDPGRQHISKLMNISEDDVHKHLYAWGSKLVHATGEYATAFKANYGFWWRSPESLRKVFADIRRLYPEVALILDAKTGDIDNTSDQWTELALFVGADAVTISPYMGVIDVTASASKAGLACFVTVCTSNKGSAQLQERRIGAGEYSVSVANIVALDTYSLEHGAVVGATHLDELENLQKDFPLVPFLIPGVGKQGGDLEKVVSLMSKHEAPWIVNVGRGIAEAGAPDQGTDQWQQAAREAARRYSEQMRT